MCVNHKSESQIQSPASHQTSKYQEDTANNNLLQYQGP